MSFCVPCFICMHFNTYITISPGRIEKWGGTNVDCTSRNGAIIFWEAHAVRLGYSTYSNMPSGCRTTERLRKFNIAQRVQEVYCTNVSYTWTICVLSYFTGRNTTAADGGLLKIRAYCCTATKLIVKQLVWKLFFLRSYPSPLMVQQPPVGQGLLIIEASRSHS